MCLAANKERKRNSQTDLERGRRTRQAAAAHSLSPLLPYPTAAWALLLHHCCIPQVLHR